jgi:hypothetical protein
MKEKTIFSLFLLVFLAFSCKKPITLPPEPVIEFVNVRTIDTIDNPQLGNQVIYNKITFYLTDGDGDVGNDTIDKINNTFLQMYKKVNGDFIQYIPVAPSGDTTLLHYRIPVLPISGGQNKTLKAHVHILVEGIDLKFLPFDTLKYEIYIKDRNNNISNTIQTPEIIVPR